MNKTFVLLVQQGIQCQYQNINTLDTFPPDKSSLCQKPPYKNLYDFYNSMPCLLYQKQYIIFLTSFCFSWGKLSKSTKMFLNSPFSSMKLREGSKFPQILTKIIHSQQLTSTLTVRKCFSSLEKRM